MERGKAVSLVKHCLGMLKAKNLSDPGVPNLVFGSATSFKHSKSVWSGLDDDAIHSIDCSLTASEPRRNDDL